jgi:hypothetical protein
MARLLTGLSNLETGELLRFGRERWKEGCTNGHEQPVFDGAAHLHCHDAEAFMIQFTAPNGVSPDAVGGFSLMVMLAPSPKMSHEPESARGSVR